ncbi:MAG: hypothetical protein ACK5HR_00260 [Mycoplasmatales bacterium]
MQVLQGLLAAFSEVASVTKDINTLKVVGVLNVFLVIVVLILVIIILINSFSKNKKTEEINVTRQASSTEQATLNNTNVNSANKSSILAKTKYNRRKIIK